MAFGQQPRGEETNALAGISIASLRLPPLRMDIVVRNSVLHGTSRFSTGASEAQGKLKSLTSGPPALAQVGQQLKLQKTSEDRFSFRWALKVDDPP